MLRFTNLLASGLKNRGGTVEILAPRRILVGPNANPGKGFWKWLGYFDKWILFPLILRRIVKSRQREFGQNIRYHVCDHSNSPYLACLPSERTGITCHDVLAIRGALGYADSYCAASRTGVWLQRWILKHLRKSRRIACVSRLTYNHLCEIAEEKIPPAGWMVIHNAFNANFRRIETGQAIQILKQKGIAVPQPYLLHVGSNLPRKNRAMLLRMIRQGEQTWPGYVCFAGEPADAPLSELARALGILDRISSVPGPDHETLCALYSLAHAFVFPSLSEGFGWPLIEAQACGTPVIASRLEPLPEVSGGAALHADPHDAKSFAAALQQLDEPALKDTLTQCGLNNVTRFGLPAMIDKYLELHAGE